MHALRVIADILAKSRIVSDWKLGAHVSAAGGVENAVTNAVSIGFVRLVDLMMDFMAEYF